MISTIPASLLKKTVDTSELPTPYCPISNIPVAVYQQIYQAIIDGEDPGDLNIKNLGSFPTFESAASALAASAVTTDTTPLFNGTINNIGFLMVQQIGTEGSAKVVYQYMFYENGIQIRKIIDNVPGEFIPVGGSDEALAARVDSLEFGLSELSKEIEGFSSEIADVQSSIEKEIADRTAADQALSDKIDAIEIPEVPTKVSELENDAKYQSDTEVDSRIQSVIGTAPEALDTLKELANSLGNDPDFAGTVTKELAKKADKSEVEIKANQSDVDFAVTSLNDKIEEKADKSEVSIKANQADVDTQVNIINEKLDEKADADDVEASVKDLSVIIDMKADKSEVSIKANQSDVDFAINTINNKVDTKADKTEVALKANQSDVDAQVDIINDKLESKVEFLPFEEVRKTIQLANHDNLSGIGTNGQGYNLAMVSKWNKADFGSSNIPFNMNGSEKRPTYNDTKEVALLEDIPTAIDVPSKISELENDSNFQNAEQVNARIQAVVDAAPEALDTLKELADALGNDPDFVSTITEELSKKADKSEVALKANQVDVDSQVNIINDKLMTKADISAIPEIPTALPNPNALTIKFNGQTAFTYDGSKSETGNFTVNAEVVPMSSTDASSISAAINSKADKEDLNGFATEKWVEDKGYLTEHQDISLLATKSEVESEKVRAEAIESKLQEDLTYVADTVLPEMNTNTAKALDGKVSWDESKKIIVLPEGGKITGTMSDGNGAVLAQINQWGITDLGSSKLSTTINSLNRPKVQEAGISGENAESIAYLSDIKNSTDSIENKITDEITRAKAKESEIEEKTNKAVQFTIIDEGRKIVTLDNAQLINARSNPDELENKVDVSGAISLIQLNKWNVVDIGSPITLTNINTPDGVRPTVQEKSQSGPEANQIAYLSDIEKLQATIEALTIRIQELEQKING